MSEEEFWAILPREIEKEPNFKPCNCKDEEHCGGESD